MTPFERRIAALEAAKSATAPVPFVLRVGMNETRDEAFARFNAAYPHRKPGSAVLCVPAKPTTPEEQALYEVRLKQNQVRLVRDARREPMTLVPEPSPVTTPMRWPSSPVVPPRGRAISKWKANTTC